MPRVKRGIMTHKRHKKIISRAKGYFGARSHLFKTANEAVAHALQYAYRDRR
ncbi:MAG: 50S ribosomal protein L20, partial [Armatimonadota bacterium]